MATFSSKYIRVVFFICPGKLKLNNISSLSHPRIQGDKIQMIQIIMRVNDQKKLTM